MKENIIKIALTGTITLISVYFDAISLAFSILMLAIVCDYISGMVKAWLSKSLNSKSGIKGIVKKLCYLMVVCVGIGVDWVIYSFLEGAEINYDMPVSFGVLVAVWLIINEMISILENLAEIGVPFPSFLVKIVSKLKISIDEKGGGGETK